MFKSISNIAKLSILDLWPQSCCKSQLLVRSYRVKPTGPIGHRRKPIWLGTAKTKLLRFPKWFPYREGELDEMTKLYNDYKCAKKSLFQYFKNEYDKVSDTSDIAALRQKEEEEEHIRLMEKNRLENERISKIREVRVKKNLEEKKERILQAHIRHDKRVEERLQSIEEIVRLEKERAKSFVTRETLDEAIDRALESEVDYNFAIDLSGKIYKGRKTTAVSKIIQLKPVAAIY